MPGYDELNSPFPPLPKPKQSSREIRPYREAEEGGTRPATARAGCVASWVAGIGLRMVLPPIEADPPVAHTNSAAELQLEEVV
jgi:hypothetical protein